MTTSFGICVFNNIDRSQFTVDAMRGVHLPGARLDAAQQWYSEQIQHHLLHVSESGEIYRSSGTDYGPLS